LKLYQNVTPGEVPGLIRRHWSPDTVFLHYTGSMFGMGCSALSKEAVDRVDELKQRPGKKGFIILIPHISWLEKLKIRSSIFEVKLMEQYWPGNVTFLLPTEDENLAYLARHGKIAVRVPYQPMLQELISAIGEPIISTSINKAGMPFMTDMMEIKKKLPDWFDLGFVPTKKQMQNEMEPSTIIEFIDHQLKCHREGSVPFFEIRESYEHPLILFTCTGNICRSPIAEYVARQLFTELEMPYRTASAGIINNGVPISRYSLQVLMEHQINASEHFSRVLNRSMISSSWLILTMEVQQKVFLRNMYPQYAYKIHALNEFTGFEGSIEDPFEKELEVYRDTYDNIQEKIEILVNILIEIDQRFIT